MRTFIIFLNTISSCLTLGAIIIVMNFYSQSWASTELPMRMVHVPKPAMKPLPGIKAENRKTEWKWWRRHSQINHRMKQGNVDLLFLGDSITQGWNNNPTWKTFYQKRNAVNAGIWSDRTQHTLWRLQNGDFALAKPKLVVLLIGGNNLMMESTRQVAGGIQKNVEEINRISPETKILVVGILPGGELPNHPRRAKARQVNAILKDVLPAKHVKFIDIGDRFLTKKGKLGKRVSKDGLHLTRFGYAILGRSLEPSIAKLMGDQPIIAGRKDLPNKKGPVARR